MRKNPFILAGILCLVICALLVAAWLRRGSRQQVENRYMVQVVMARQTIPDHTIILNDMIESRTIDSRVQAPPQDAVHSIGEVAGKLAKSEIHPGKPIAAGLLMDPKDWGLAYRVPPDRRALTISVTDTTGVAGLVRPGDVVDVLGTFTATTPGSAGMTTTLVQRAQVIAVGKSLETQPLNAQPADAQKLVTLAVSPQEARWICSAQTHATLQLALRPLQDTPELASSEAPPAMPPDIGRRPVVIRPASRPAPRRVVEAPRPKPRAKPLYVGTGMGIGPLPPVAPLPPEKPKMVYPLTAEIAAPTPAPVPAPRAVAPASPPPHTVEVIRGGRRESVVLPDAGEPGKPAVIPAPSEKTGD